METPNQDTTALQNYAGSYSRDLIGQTLNGLDILNHCKVIYNLTAPLNLTKLVVNGGIRPLDTAVFRSDKPGRKWSGRKLTPRTGMKIFEIVPAELNGTWMSEMLAPNATDVPFAEWVWTQEFAKLAEEINDNIKYSEFHGDESDYDATLVYHANDYVVYGDNRDIYKVTGTTVAGNNPTDTPAKFTKVNAVSLCDGPLTIIQQELTAGHLTAVVTGATDQTNAIANLTLLDASAPEVIRGKPRRMFMSRNIYEAYTKAYDAAFGKPRGNILYEEDKREKTFLYGTDGLCELVPCSWMAGSQRIFMTRADNLVMGTNVLSDITGIGKTVQTLHGFNAICKFILSFQFADLEVLYVNDQV